MFFNKDGMDIKPDMFELYRYAGYPAKTIPPEPVVKLAEDCVREMQQVIVPKLVYEIFDREQLAYIIDTSRNLTQNMKDSKKVLLFAATIGPRVDALIRKTQYTDTAKAGLMQACGAMFIESFVNEFNDKIKSEYQSYPRFSPGFGDVPLQVQKDFFRLLPASKIGLTLMESCLMAPEKSVSAFIGLL